MMARVRRTEREPEHNAISIVVRGRAVRGVYSAADGWVEVIGENGLPRTARCGDSTAGEVAERLLREMQR